MSTRETVTVVVAPDGTVTAETHGIHGTDCLDYIAVLEDLLDATTVSSAHTADYTRARATVETTETVHDVDRL
ncbi:hypothetical protein Ais01nite_15490 [Asanoa ishikariensis]|uniref:DUF2997 domain-containing protein n=1 Tax=Asanoa ishikariensis TaxID=137265 RepID=A0A1H3UHA7_9ACTN|nr:DUF2997 domain-containing protein [Asanoa ishikariensis]GIF63514.1 hypothetical protein Ais01nite_15490 [Asanoa ishikariensis]SDZ61843.1 Protein of unknown function [Asanoa ishikariensis]